MSDTGSQAEAGWPVLHFAQANPTGEGQGNVAALLRRVADTLEGLGDVDILDIVFTVTASWPEDEVSARVYYCVRDVEDPRGDVLT